MREPTTGVVDAGKRAACTSTRERGLPDPRIAGIQFFPELELAVLYLIAALVLLVQPPLRRYLTSLIRDRACWLGSHEGCEDRVSYRGVCFTAGSGFWFLG